MLKITAVLLVVSSFVAACGDLSPTDDRTAVVLPSDLSADQPKKPRAQAQADQPAVSDPVSDLAAWPIDSMRPEHR
jgi:hypothetical protein